MRILMLTALFSHCFLQLCAGISVDDLIQGSKREARDVGEPAPIDCKMTAWSEWAPCDPCTKTEHRSRGIEVFGQFGGQTCIEPIGEKKACIPATQCVVDPTTVCSVNEFFCNSDIGFCIKSRLLCNGDNDCGDLTDEEDCDKIHSPCGNSDVSESEIALSAGNGINILGSSPRMNPFNNKVYNGICNRVKEPSTLSYNRIPWNVGVLNYETLVEETTSKEIYKDTHSLLREITQDITSKTSIGLSFKFTPSNTDCEKKGTHLESASAGLNTEFEMRDMIKTITEYSTSTEKFFFRVKGKVQLGTYRMRSRGLEVSQTFLSDVAALPIKYEKGQYFDFLEDYGTHYTKNGRVGGEYELVYVLNKKVITDMHKTETLLKNCLKIGINADFQLKGDIPVGFKPSIVPIDRCEELTNDKTKKDISEQLIEKVISAVKGGSAQSATALKSQLSKVGVLERNHYVEWARTLSDLPAIIHSDPEPIYNAIPLSLAQPRRENLQKALDEYLAEYSVCKCQPCQNGGTVIQIDGKCICLCPLAFEGLACQTKHHELIKDTNQPIEQQGNWGCWSSWSLCSGGQRRRTRYCKTGGILGATCKGDTVSEEYC